MATIVFTTNWQLNYSVCRYLGTDRVDAIFATHEGYDPWCMRFNNKDSISVFVRWIWLWNPTGNWGTFFQISIFYCRKTSFLTFSYHFSLSFSPIISLHSFGSNVCLIWYIIIIRFAYRNFNSSSKHRQIKQPIMPNDSGSLIWFSRRFYDVKTSCIVRSKCHSNPYLDRMQSFDWS